MVFLLFVNAYGSAHKTLIRIACAQKAALNVHIDVSSGASSLKFGLSLNLQPYFCVCQQRMLWRVYYLTYRGSERAIPLHALQITNMVSVLVDCFLTSFNPLSCIMKAVLRQVPFSLRFDFQMNIVIA